MFSKSLQTAIFESNRRSEQKMLQKSALRKSHRRTEATTTPPQIKFLRANEKERMEFVNLLSVSFLNILYVLFAIIIATFKALETNKGYV